MAALRSSSVLESWSKGLGNSVIGTHGAVFGVKIFHLEVSVAESNTQAGL